MKRWSRRLLVAIGLCVCPLPLVSQEIEIDVSACRGMYAVLEAMHKGAPKDKVSSMLDTLLDTRPYQTMFQHYNRPWRPNHLPKAVFKRMILSLQFDGVYSPGENERADTMRSRWTQFYPNLSTYESQLHQLDYVDLHKLINDSVAYAQSWLPQGWKIPKFYFPIIPNGGSPAFAIEDVQGYDFLQLSGAGAPRPGEIDLNWLAGTVAHESHHLGMRSNLPAGLSREDAMAYKVVTLCIEEGVATEFISGPPAGRVPALSKVPFHFTNDEHIRIWNQHVAEEAEILRRQTVLLDKALAGRLTEDELDKDLREYWLNGLVGRAYVLGSEMFGAIYIAFGKEGVFSAMQDPRRLFDLYNKALAAKPEALRRCIVVPDKAVKQALAIGR